MAEVDLAILVPILHRAHRVAPLVESIRATCDARVLFLTSPGDVKVWAAVDRAGCERLEVPWNPVGDYARKINTGYGVTTEPLLFTGADDLTFLPGWLEAARAALAPGVGVVGTNDLGNPRVMRGEHATHFLITRAYVDQYGTIDGPGEVMHTGYVHEFVDDEVVGTAKKRQAFAFAVDSHVRHDHPNWRPEVPVDAGYAQQSDRLRASRPLFQQRRRLWA